MRPNDDWLPRGKIGAICFSIDDVHPVVPPRAARSVMEAASCVLERLHRLLDAHPQLKATLFVTPDWRPAELVSTGLLGQIPILSELVYHVALHPEGLLRLDRHPEFLALLRRLPRTEIAPHGLHHVHRGPRLAVEFQRQSYAECVQAIRRAMQIFEVVDLAFSRGFCPPGWNLPPPLLAALEDLGFGYVTAARDIQTPIRPDATNAMSGLLGVSIVRPERIGSRDIVHIPVNFQATSQPERAYALIESGGLLSIKAHAFKHEGGHTMLDGLDDGYCRYLDALFRDLESRYGDSLWWTSMGEMAAVCRTSPSATIQ